MDTNTEPCPSCTELVEQYGGGCIAPAEVVDPATGIKICGECYDAYYTDPYAANGVRRSDF